MDRVLGYGALAAVLLALACGGSDSDGGANTGGAGSGGAGGSSGDAAAARETLVMLLTSARSKECTSATDCIVFTANCVQSESGNCAGHFYLSKNQLTSFEAARAEYESVSGQGCNSGGSCGLGPAEPSCVQGRCAP